MKDLYKETYALDNLEKGIEDIEVTREQALHVGGNSIFRFIMKNAHRSAFEAMMEQIAKENWVEASRFQAQAECLGHIYHYFTKEEESNEPLDQEL